MGWPQWNTGRAGRSPIRGGRQNKAPGPKKINDAGYARGSKRPPKGPPPGKKGFWK